MVSGHLQAGTFSWRGASVRSLCEADGVFELEERELFWQCFDQNDPLVKMEEIANQQWESLIRGKFYLPARPLEDQFF